MRPPRSTIGKIVPPLRDLVVLAFVSSYRSNLKTNAFLQICRLDSHLDMAVFHTDPFITRAEVAS